ncbi:JmjC domain-containing protein [Paraliomyxa miuraensis]|uniref:JmjC domain-containing protein n=1 Tax=Paraliomyxa miuraensis TaxID=376150 RepID=UPI00225B02CA|nr:cupin domain-containing protein [Paraliomyxa miuraensis]MCX4246364.1 HEXXH motif-containing putative peptide modification protein [Paraliomyxa miuraensis]
MSLLGLDETFFRDCWRRRPVVLRGAAQALIAEAPTPADMERLQALPRLHCTTDGKTVWFYQQLVGELPLIERLTTAGRALFEWEPITCDIVHTRGPASIGCHFDEDDNFSIQLCGSKRWRLSPPSTLPPDLLRLRMLKEPNVGNAPLGPDVTELLVESGDVLYIPQSWIHWGESTGDSLSISLVVNSRTFHLDFAEAMAEALRRVPGWACSPPVGPGSTAARERALDALVERTLGAEAAEYVRPQLHTRTTAAPLAVDMARVRSFVAAAPPPPVEGLVVPGEGGDAHRRLRALLARRTLRRLLLAVTKRVASTGSVTFRILYQQCLDALLALPDAELERVCTEPELVSLAALAKDDGARHEDPLAAELARALVPELSAAGIDSMPFAMLPDLDGGFTVRRAGLRLVARRPLGELVTRVVDGTWQVFIDGRFRAPEQASGLRMERLPRLLDHGPHLSPAPTTWVARSVRDQELAAAEPPAFARFCDAMRSGAQALAHAWPAAWREVADGIRWLLPLPDRGHAPHGYRVHVLRGLIVSGPCRDRHGAQTLVHEAGHDRLSTIFDLLPLCSDPGQVVRSPAVDAARTVSSVLRSGFALAQDVALLERLVPLASADERVPLERELDACRAEAAAALDVLEREVETTEVGAAVLREIGRALGR